MKFNTSIKAFFVVMAILAFFSSMESNAIIISNFCKNTKFHLYNKTLENRCNRWIEIPMHGQKDENISDCLGEGFVKGFIEPLGTISGKEFTSNDQRIVCWDSTMWGCECDYPHRR